MNSYLPSSLLSDAFSGEHDLSVVARKRTFWYVDERNLQSMPVEKAEAGVEGGYEFNV